MIQGNRVRLRAVERADLDSLWQWRNDEDVMYYWSFPGATVSMAELERRFITEAEAVEPFRLPLSRSFIIETQEGAAIGLVAYYFLDVRHRRVEVAIQLGEKEYWGRGYGTDAMLTFLGYLFGELNLERIHLHTQDYNMRGIASYEKCGFVKEGRLRRWYFVRGRYHDGYIMSILREDFERRVSETKGEGDI